jgi:transposase
MAGHRHELSEEQWRRINNLLPSDQPKGAFRPLSNWRVVNAILWILRSGAPWRDLPERFPNWKSVHTRFVRWSRAGIWNRVLDALAVDADDEVAILDASIVRVHMDAVGGKVTQALEMLKDSRSRWVLADKAYDSNAVVAAIDSHGSIAVIPSRRGRRIERPHDRELFRWRFLVEHFFRWW